MGLATLDPHSHKVYTKFYKISKFGVNRLNSKKERYSHLKMSKFIKKSRTCRAIRTLDFFVNFDVFKSL